MRAVIVKFRRLSWIELLVDLVVAKEPLQPATEFLAMAGPGSVTADGAGHRRPAAIRIVELRISTPKAEM